MSVCIRCQNIRPIEGKSGLCEACIRFASDVKVGFASHFASSLAVDATAALRCELEEALRQKNVLQTEVHRLEKLLSDRSRGDAAAQMREREKARDVDRRARIAVELRSENTSLKRRLMAVESQLEAFRQRTNRQTLEDSGVTGDQVFSPSPYRLEDS